MTSSHQRLSDYKGSMYGEPRYSGLEYDWEIPDNMVDTSPGGADTTHHHWTKGFYGEGASSGDVYAGQGNRYIAAEYGNLYQVGDTAAQHMGYYTQAPDTKFEDRLTSGNPAFRDSPKYERPIQDPVQRLQAEGILTRKGQKKADSNGDMSREGFELIDVPSDSRSTPQVAPNPSVTTSTDSLTSGSGTSKSYKLRLANPLVAFIIAIFIFIILNLFGYTAETFVKEYLHNGKDPSWKTLLYYTILMIAILVIVLWLLGIPLVKVDKL